MFNFFRDLEDDPFFSHPLPVNDERMRQMMRSLSEPLGQNSMPSLEEGRQRGRQARGQSVPYYSQREEQRDPTYLNPFELMDSMVSSMRSRIEEVHKTFENISSDPNAHSFSSSTVMSYSKMGDDEPKVYQASSQTRCAPGGIKETRRSLRDSESGVEKMAIGHHINDRGHVIEKKHNRKTGEQEMIQDFHNLDEAELQSFGQEWEQGVSKFQTHSPMSQVEAPRPRAAHRTSLTHNQLNEKQS